jgi:hypothetical protein
LHFFLKKIRSLTKEICSFGMQSCRLRTTGVYLPIGCAPASVKRRALVRCQISNSANDYSTLENSELKKELRTRGLSISGRREQLIHRLHLSDAPPPITPLPDTTATEVAPLLVVAKTEIKEEKPASVKKPRAVRKKKTAAPALISNDDGVLDSSSSSIIITEQKAQPAEQQQQLKETTLLKLAKGELQAMAVARDLAKSGTKAQIAARILAVELGTGIRTSSIKSSSAVASDVPAAPKQRAPRKKTNTRKKISTESTSTTTTPSEASKPFAPPSPLRLSQSAFLNSKRRVLDMMEASIAVAATITAAQNLKWQEKEKQERQKFENKEAKVASSASPRRLSPDEAVKVLEEVVRRKGTGGVGLGTGLSSGTDGNSDNGSGNVADDVLVVPRSRKHVEVSSQVDLMKTAMAGFKNRLNAQEHNTEQLRASMQKSSGKKVAARARVLAGSDDGVHMQEEQTMVDEIIDKDGRKTRFSMMNTQQEHTTPTPSRNAIDTAKAFYEEDTQLQSALEFALTVGKVMTVLGRGLVNSIMKKTKYIHK